MTAVLEISEHTWLGKLAMPIPSDMGGAAIIEMGLGKERVMN